MTLIIKTISEVLLLQPKIRISVTVKNVKKMTLQKTHDSVLIV